MSSLQRRPVSVVLATVLLSVACVGQLDPELRLEVVEGDAQEGTVGQPLARPLTVRVLRGQEPVAGATVAFAPAVGSGTVEVPSATTGADGQASAGRWTLGTRAGGQSVLASSPAVASLSLGATARAGVGINVEAFEGNNQQGPAGMPLAVPPAKRITDTFGNPVAGLDVEWSVIAGGGEVMGPTTVPTDAQGVSRLQGWRLGATPGANRLVARMPGLPQTTFEATGTSAGMPSMVIEAGDNLSANAGQPVPTAPAVRLRGADGQPLVGVQVSFAPASGGSVTGSPAVSDAQGIARVGQWRLGPTAGAQTLTARAQGLPDVTFRATALAGGAPMVTRTVHLSGLANPWDLAFAPDGTLVFTERRGDIRVLRPGQTAASLLHRPSDVNASGQSGMMGLALDPDFASTRHLFAYFSAQVNGTTVDNRVVRFRVAEDWSGVSDRQDLLVGISWGNGGAHSGGRLRFGPDGLLYLTTGDTRSATVPQDPQALGSKVLRLRKDGTIPAGNLGTPYRPAIWAFGFRNPQGLAFRPGSGDPFLCEHGPGNDDEVTRLTAGGNGGWDPRNPGNPSDVSTYWGYMGTSMTDLTKFPSALRPTWRDTNSGGMSGCDFLRGAQWRDWDGALAVASLGDRTLRVLRLNSAGTEVEGMVSTLFGGMDRLRAVVQGPDGALYLSTDGRAGGDQVWRVTAQ